MHFETEITCILKRLFFVKTGMQIPPSPIFKGKFMTPIKEFYKNYEELDWQELMDLCYYYYELGYNDNTLGVGFSPFNRKTIERDLAEM